MAQPMFSMQQSVLTPMKNERPSGCGCLGGGCVIAFIIFLLIAGALAWGAWSTFNGLRSMTSTAPKSIAVFAATPEQYRQAAAKVKAFETIYNSGAPAELVLTADEINTLIARDPGLAALRGHVFVTMHQSRIAAQISAPLSQIRAFSDRYFNGEASMSFIIEEGKPRPVSVSVKANGNEFPSWLIRYITSKDFVENLDLPSTAVDSGVMTNLLSMEVRDEKLIIRAQKK